MPVSSASEQPGQTPRCPLFRVLPDLRLAVLVGSPAEALLLEPYTLQRGFFAGAKKMIRLVEEDRRPLGIVDRGGKEPWIERYHFKRKICGRVSILMPHV